MHLHFQLVSQSQIIFLLMIILFTLQWRKLIWTRTVLMKWFIWKLTWIKHDNTLIHWHAQNTLCIVITKHTQVRFFLCSSNVLKLFASLLYYSCIREYCVDALFESYAQSQIFSRRGAVMSSRSNAQSSKDHFGCIVKTESCSQEIILQNCVLFWSDT